MEGIVADANVDETCIARSPSLSSWPEATVKDTSSVGGFMDDTMEFMAFADAAYRTNYFY